MERGICEGRGVRRRRARDRWASGSPASFSVGLAAALAVAFGAGCPGLLVVPGETPVGDDDSPLPAVEDDACNHWEAWGNFGLFLSDRGGRFNGIFYDDPSALMLEELIQEGDCTFLGLDPMPHCEPSCDPPQVCGPDDECLDWPEGLDLGLLELAGTDPAVTLEPGYANAYFTEQTYPGFLDPGEEVTLGIAGGGVIEPVALRVQGVALWDEPPAPLSLALGQDLTVSWQPASSSTDAKVALYIGADHHAGVTAHATCVVVDADGALVVPTSIVDALLEAGAGGLGTNVENSRLLRVDTASTWTERGCAMFYTAAETLLDVEIAGGSCLGTDRTQKGGW